MTTHQSIKLTMKQEDRVEFIVSQKELRRSKSDAKILPESRSSSKSNKLEIERVECECCGIGEECTPMYIEQIRRRFCGRWVCGLCSEAVKEEGLNQRASRVQEMEMEAALQSHMAVCRSFKSSTLNPQLSLASAMRDIAKKSFQQRLTHTAGDFLAASVAASRRPPPASGKYRRSSFH